MYEQALRVIGSPSMTAAISVSAVGLAFTARLVRSLAGWPALGGGLSVLVALAVVSILVRRRELEWRGLLPISLLAFVGWCAISVLWSNHQWASLGGVIYQIAFCLLGVYIALLRDLIQIIRAVGDVIRVTLAASFATEIFAGLLIDMPIRFLGVEGNLATGLPIQGIFGTRNQLGIVALIGVITFTAELLTRSVTRTVSVFSLCAGIAGIALTHSPVTIGATLAAVIAACAMLGLRRLAPSARKLAQFILLGVSTVSLLIVWSFRSQIIEVLNAGSEFEVRYELWRGVLGFVRIRPLEGWGWVGLWQAELQPYLAVNQTDGRQHASALNAFVDVLFQTGVIGLFCFIVFVALTLVRSWLLAANQRSVVFVWPAIVLIALLITSLAESTILVEFGWLVFVMCSIAAAHRLSWRQGYDAIPVNPANGAGLARD